MRTLILVLLLVNTYSLYAQKIGMLVGTYTSTTSKGIYSYWFNVSTGMADSITVVETENPSFLAVAPNKKYVFAVNENNDATAYLNGGSVSAFAYEASTGVLAFINKQSSEGKHPCYITISNNGKTVIIGNYTGGNIVTYAVNDNGSLTTAQQIIQHKGSSIHIKRQEAAHVHATVLNKNNTVLYVPDLGIDSVKLYNFNAYTGMLTSQAQQAVGSIAGSGPRHFCFDNKERYAYLMEELTGTIQVYKVHKKTGSLQAIQRINPYGKNMTDSIGSADIHISPNGKFLYCSNRAAVHTIGIFKVLKNGMLRYIQLQSTEGLTPRNFNIDPTGKFLLVANQNSNNIVVFAIHATTGLLENTHKNIIVPNPVCIAWVK
jgi:6-phosphogluconolactonase